MRQLGFKRTKLFNFLLKVSIRLEKKNMFCKKNLNLFLTLYRMLSIYIRLIFKINIQQIG